MYCDEASPSIFVKCRRHLDLSCNRDERQCDMQTWIVAVIEITIVIVGISIARGTGCRLAAADAARLLISAVVVPADR